jgi:hypothetical protein
MSEPGKARHAVAVAVRCSWQLRPPSPSRLTGILYQLVDRCTSLKYRYRFKHWFDLYTVTVERDRIKARPRP